MYTNTLLIKAAFCGFWGPEQNCIGAPMNGRVVEGPMQIDMKEIHSDMSSLLMKIFKLPREISWIEF